MISLKTRGSLTRRSIVIVFAGGYFVGEVENVAGLASRCSADRLEGREADRSRLASLEDRLIGERDINLGGKLGQTHPTLVKHFVQRDRDGHYTVPSRSSRISVPSAKARAKTKLRKTASQPLIEKPASSSRGSEEVETASAMPPMTRLRSCSASSAHAIACSR